MLFGAFGRCLVDEDYANGSGKGTGRIVKPEHLLLGAGMAFVIGLVAVAMIPDDAWEQDISYALPSVANEVGADGGIANPAYMGPNGLAAQGVSSAVPQAWNIAMPGLRTFSRASTVRFDGKVVEVVTRGKDIDWGQVHVWLDSSPFAGQEVSLAPDWFLSYQGCSVATGNNVRGVAFRFDTKVPDSELYAKTISVNGQKCRLRNDEGFALWSNRLQ